MGIFVADVAERMLGLPMPAPPARVQSHATAPAASVAVVTLPAAKTVSLAAKHPTLSFTLKVSAATILQLKLVAAHGQTLGSWSVRVAKGAKKLSLVVHGKARRPGKDKLVIAQRGSTRTKALTVSLVR